MHLFALERLVVYLQQYSRSYYNEKMKGLDDYLNRHMPFVNRIIEENISALPLAGQEVARHITKLPGKGLRPGLLLLMAGASGFDFVKNSHQAYSLSAALELVHCASLLHDDMEDEAPIRRGKKTAHIVYGAKGTLLAGDALLALAITLAAREGNNKTMLCMAEAMLSTVCGQIEGLAKTEQLGDYIQAITHKTGSLVAAACKLGAMLANSNQKQCNIAGELGYNLGIAFQLADDWLDFFPSQLTGKAMASDLSKANFTLPIRVYIETLAKAEKEKFYKKFISGRFDEQEKAQVCEAVRCFKVQDELIKFSEKYLCVAQECALHFPQGAEIELVKQLINNIRLKFRGPKCPQK